MPICISQVAELCVEDLRILANDMQAELGLLNDQISTAKVELSKLSEHSPMEANNISLKIRRLAGKKQAAKLIMSEAVQVRASKQKANRQASQLKAAPQFKSRADQLLALDRKLNYFENRELHVLLGREIGRQRLEEIEILALRLAEPGLRDWGAKASIETEEIEHVIASRLRGR